MNAGGHRSTRSIETEAARWVARTDANLSPAERDELERWLAADPRHEAAFRRYESGWAALAQPARAGSGAVLERKVRELSVRRRCRRAALLGGFAATLLLAGIFGEQLWPPASLDSARAVVVRPQKQMLPDGSMVEFRTDARITPDYQPSRRRVVLEHGTAYFSVQSDPARPFTVEANGVEVRAIGTAFSVQITPGHVEVLVSEGTVLIGSQTHRMPDRAPPVVEETRAAVPAKVAAGNRAIVDSGRGEVTEIAALDTRVVEEMLAWRSPRIDFTRTRLSEAVELLNAHAPPDAPPLVIGDERAGALRVTGVFRPDNTDAFVRLLEAVFGIRALRTGDVIVLHAAE